MEQLSQCFLTYIVFFLTFPFLYLSFLNSQIAKRLLGISVTVFYNKGAHPYFLGHND